MARLLGGFDLPTEVGLLLGKPLIDATGKFSHFIAEDVVRGTRARLVRATDDFLRADGRSAGGTRWTESEYWGRSAASPPPIAGEPIVARDVARGVELSLWTGDVGREILHSKQFDATGRATEVLTGVSFPSTRGQAAFFRRVRFHPDFALHNTHARSGREIKDFHDAIPAWRPRRPIVLHADSDPELEVFYINADVSPSAIHNDTGPGGSVMTISPEMFAKIVSNDHDIRKLVSAEEDRPIVVISSSAAAPGSTLGQRFADALQNQEQLRRDVYVSRTEQVVWEHALDRASLSVERVGDIPKPSASGALLPDDEA
ncbi:hypothetical protein [Nocardia sp. NPDC003963]